MKWLPRQGRIRSLALLTALCIAMSTTQAADRSTADEVASNAPSLTLARALLRVLRDSPELKTFPYSLRAAEARAMQAGFSPNPELSLDLENFAGDDAFSGTDSAEITLALSQVIELGGKRRFRQEVAQLVGDRLRQDYELARLDVLARAAGAFLNLVQAQQQLQLAEQAKAWAETAQRAAHARFKAGSASRAELSQARIEAMQATLRVSEQRAGVETARHTLAAQWGAQEPEFGKAQADLFQLSATPEFAQLRARLDQSPQLQRYLTLDRLRQAELELAIANGRQNLSIGVGVRRFEDTGEQVFTTGLSIPLGINNRNQGNIAAARADLERLSSERRASKILLYNRLFTLYQSLQQARHRVTLLQEQMLPEARKALTQTEQGYRRGRFTYLELVETRRQRLRIERDLIDAAIGFHRALLTLEQLTGEPLTQSPRSIMLLNNKDTQFTQDNEP